MAQVGFIGMGNMGSAILEGLLKIYPGEELVFTAAHREKMEEVTARTGVPHGSSNADCASRCKYLILAVKPRYFETGAGDYFSGARHYHPFPEGSPGP